jgi:DNA polymerase-4
VAIKDTDFKVIRKQEKLKLSIAATSDIIKHACRLFNMLWDGQVHLRHIEVRVSVLIPDDVHQQMILFKEDMPNHRGEKIDGVIDLIRARYGSNSIIRARLLHSGFKSMSGGHPGGDEVPNMRSEL